MTGNNAFRDVPFMGVIYVVDEAMKLGFYNGNPDWCNLGQGQPEIGEMEGAPPRYKTLDMEPGDHAYGHINGTDAMCQTVADHYNRLFRKGKDSQYGPENVAIVSGGRLGLTRVFAALGDITLGYQIPDYTAYEDMLAAHMHRMNQVMIEAREEDGFAITPKQFDAAVKEHNLDAFIFSNPNNPTGQVIQGDDLESYINTCRDNNCTLISDEFYSHFIYNADGTPGEGPISAAPFIDDVNVDPVLLIDGLTKNYRYPGWRCGWVVGPKEMISTIGRAASAIDGGPPQPIQRAAIDILEPKRADQETDALREVFVAKRNVMLERLSKLGVKFAHKAEGTFYLWGSIEDLPAPFNDAEVFFREALAQKVMVVPGKFFDVNPGKKRTGTSPYNQWLRFSFGPPMDNVLMGLDRLEALINAAR